MIPRLPGWSWEVRGGGVTLVPPEGATAGVIRYRERAQPLRSVRALLADKLGAGVEISNEPMITTEGEYACVVDIRHPMDGPLVQRTIGYVFGDDWYSSVAGVALRPDQFSRIARVVRELVRDTRLMLGVRRRRFVYRAPRGWSGYSRLPMFTTWFPSTYRADPTSLTVYPAIPAPPNEEVHFGLLAFGPPAAAEVLDMAPPLDVIASSQLAGKAWELEVRDENGRTISRRFVMLRDARYVYPVYLDAPLRKLAEREHFLDELVRSIERIPSAEAVRGDPGLFDHYL